MPVNRQLLIASLALSLLSACPTESPEILPTPEMTVEPTVSPTPSITPTPLAAAQTVATLEPLKWVRLENGDIVSDSFKLNFGPGSKGFDFGPGSKGFEFGPGSKGFNALNLRFDIRYPEILTDPSLAPFTVQQSALAFGGPKIQEVVIEFIRDNQVYATATAIPRRSIIEVPASFAPGDYQLSVLLKTATHTQQLSWQRLTLTDSRQTVLRVDVYGDTDTRPEDLDVGVLTRTEPLPAP